MKKEFERPELIIILFDDDMATDIMGASSGDMSTFDPDDPNFPGY